MEGANPHTLWTKLFVGGLPYHTTDQELTQYFQQFGAIREAAIILEKENKKSKGYGFVSSHNGAYHCLSWIGDRIIERQGLSGHMQTTQIGQL